MFFIYSLTSAGLPSVISKFVAERAELGDYKGSRTVFRSAFTMMLGFGLVASLFTYFGSGLMADYCQMSETQLMFMFIAPTFLFTTISSALRGYFQGRHNMTPTAVSQIIEQIINSVLTVVLEILFINKAQKLSLDTVTYAAAGFALATALAAAGAAVFLTFLFAVRYRNSRRKEIRQQTYDGPTLSTATVTRQLIRYIIPALISCIAASATDLIDTKSAVPLLMAGGWQKWEAYALFGIYSTKYQRLLTLPAMFAAPLVTAMIPPLAAALARRDYKSFRLQVREGYKINYLVVLPVVAGLMFLAKPILTVIFPTQNEGAPLVIFWTWTAIFITISSIQSGILVALGRPLLAPVNVLIGMVVKIACNYLLIPIHDIHIYGAAIGNTAAWLISIVLNKYFIDKIMRKKQRTWPYAILPGFAAAVMGVLCLGVYTGLDWLLKLFISSVVVASDIAVVVTVPFGACVYFVLLIRTGGLTSEDLEKLPMGGRIRSVCQKIPFLRAGLESGPAEKGAAAPSTPVPDSPQDGGGTEE